MMMTNFSLIATLADGAKLDHYFSDCRDLLNWLAGYDIAPDITSAEIIVTTDDGKTVHITIPNSHGTAVRADVDESIH
jgi:hypothetical protein